MHKVVDGVQLPLTEQEIAEFQEREAKHAAKLEALKATEYKRLRKAEYPSLEDQLDLIYHSGIDAWKAQIAAIKAKHPKPS